MNKKQIYYDTKRMSERNIYYTEPTIKYKKCFVPLEIKYNETSLMVINKDPIDSTLMLKSLNLNPLLTVINTNIEHDIYLRSNYCLTANDNFFPLDNDSLLYTASVAIFKDQEYRLITKPQGISVANLEINNEPEVLEDKLRQLLNVAYRHHHDGVVIPTDVMASKNHAAEICQKVVKEYAKCFKIILFCASTHDNYQIFKEYLLGDEVE
jgi:23S rRNA-/tRNA-specific pseudouridylate synthase